VIMKNKREIDDMLRRRDEDGDDLAQFINESLMSVHRGAVHMNEEEGWPATQPGDIVVFGNDGFTTDPRAKQEVAAVGEFARQQGFDPVHFGIDPSGVTWAVVLQPGGGVDQEFVPELAEEIDERLWEVWMEEFGVEEN